MNDDTIKRSDAIKAVSKVDDYGDGIGFEVRSHCLVELELVPSADSPQEWIPCSERLPEKDGFYLTTITDGDQIAVCKLPFAKSEWRGNWFDDEVLAWMPLPEPWKGADDETTTV